MTEPGRGSRTLWVVFWVLVGAVLACAIGIALVFTIVPARIRDSGPVPHLVGSEAPEIAARLGALSPSDKDSDDRIRDAAAVAGAGATDIRRDVQGVTVVVKVISQGPDDVCFSFAVPNGAGTAAVPFERLAKCPG